MFKSARIKLTAWYLLIIMLVSLTFSGVIYNRVCHELERGFRRVELRHRAEDLGIQLPNLFPNRTEDLPLRLREITPRYFLIKDLNEAKRRLLLNLVFINTGILALSAIAGWFLAGKTLRPIENSLEEQKRFIADASHELRTPITALKTSIEVALRDKKMTLFSARELIKDSLNDINNLQSLTSKLLSLNKYQNNGHNLVFEEIEITKIIDQAIKKISPLAQEKKVKLKIISCEQKILCNKESLEEMLLIFLDNAIKFTHKNGDVTIEARAERNWLKIKISDTGIGIPKKDIPFIFNRFYQADQSRSRENGGFGLGLSLAKRIIEIHEGKIEVDSVLNKGTAFIISLPL